MPVSETSKDMTLPALDNVGWSGFQPEWAADTVNFMPPCSVNLKALESKFLRICCSRFESVKMLRSRCGSSSRSNDSFRLSASCLKGLESD